MAEKKIGIIGGSGLEKLNIFTNSKEYQVETQYGNPSSSIISGEINDMQVCIISRHGRMHEITPSGVNNRANIMALKEAGCTHILATTACGSLREKIKPGHLVFPDQFIDFTKRRISTFFDTFENGELKHTAMADPFDLNMRNKLIAIAKSMGIEHHEKATLITIEGPRFSTRAESMMFINWGADIINMSTAPEATLAAEAGIPYAAIAMSTDYDCWKTDEEPVSWEKVLEVFNQNVQKVTGLIMKFLVETI